MNKQFRAETTAVICLSIGSASGISNIIEMQSLQLSLRINRNGYSVTRDKNRQAAHIPSNVHNAAHIPSNVHNAAHIPSNAHNAAHMYIHASHLLTSIALCIDVHEHMLNIYAINSINLWIQYNKHSKFATRDINITQNITYCHLATYALFINTQFVLCTMQTDVWLPLIFRLHWLPWTNSDI